MDKDKAVDRDGREFDTRPEDTVPMWMFDDVELSVQIMRDADEEQKEIEESHRGPTFAEWEQEQAARPAAGPDETELP